MITYLPMNTWIKLSTHRKHQNFLFGTQQKNSPIFTLNKP